MVDRLWKLAVITLDEDRHLNKTARSLMFDTPEARWKAAGIKFPGILPTSTKAARGAHGRSSDETKITIQNEERARTMHKTSRRSRSFKTIKSGMTVGGYVENGGNRQDLNI